MEIFGKVLAVLAILAFVAYVGISVFKLIVDIKDKRQAKKDKLKIDASEPLDPGFEVNNEEVE